MGTRKTRSGRAQTHRPTPPRTGRRAPNPRTAATPRSLGEAAPAAAGGLDVPGAVERDGPLLGRDGGVFAGEAEDRLGVVEERGE